jgi:IS1 family transposase
MRCKSCRRYQQDSYRYKAYSCRMDESIARLVIEGVGIRSISRVMKISVGTVLRRIRKVARTMTVPKPAVTNTIYEVDEIWTYISKKTNETWITYSLERGTNKVITFTVGARTKAKIRQVIDPILSFSPKGLCTDGLNIYRTLIPSSIHRVGLPHTRRIERFNLNLRTHLKRLSRKTICFSRSLVMLESCLRIYLYAQSNTRY